ncbi:hypothetical protein [Mucilaginibacter sp. CSA2-8R]|uniref:hypothetical protein n=1 Tax=Mucilaginibacter sp. CSA2-8R TaxID=3141542 RepID=UPI00315CB811
MLSWFKRKSNTNSFLSHWNIGELNGFKEIDNDDSIQFVDEGSNKIIYFSTLLISNNNHLLPNLHNVEPTVSESANGWQLKGVKKSGNKILLCVISLKHQDDIEWAKNFFNLIVPNSLAN